MEKQITQNIIEFIKNKNKVNPEIISFFIKKDMSKIKNVCSIILDDLKKISIDLKLLPDNYILSFIQKNLEDNNLLFSWWIWYVYELYKENNKAEKTFYYIILQNIVFDLLSIIDWFRVIEKQANKNFFKDILILIFFSILISATISYGFYYYFWKYFS